MPPILNWTFWFIVILFREHDSVYTYPVWVYLSSDAKWYWNDRSFVRNETLAQETWAIAYYLLSIAKDAPRGRGMMGMMNFVGEERLGMMIDMPAAMGGMVGGQGKGQRRGGDRFAHWYDIVEGVPDLHPSDIAGQRRFKPRVVR